MTKTAISFGALFVILLLLQVTIFDRVMLFGYGAVILFIYFIIRLPISLNKNIQYTLGFIAGLSVDIFADTPGVNALSCTLLSAIRTPIFKMYTSKEIETDRLIPSISSLGWLVYMKYLFSLVLIYSVLVYVIEYFSFFEIYEMLIGIGATSAITFLLLLSLDSIMMSKSEKRL